MMVRMVPLLTPFFWLGNTFKAKLESQNEMAKDPISHNVFFIFLSEGMADCDLLAIKKI